IRRLVRGHEEGDGAGLRRECDQGREDEPHHAEARRRAASTTDPSKSNTAVDGSGTPIVKEGPGAFVSPKNLSSKPLPVLVFHDTLTIPTADAISVTVAKLGGPLALSAYVVN